MNKTCFETEAHANTTADLGEGQPAPHFSHYGWQKSKHLIEDYGEDVFDDILRDVLNGETLKRISIRYGSGRESRIFSSILYNMTGHTFGRGHSRGSRSPDKRMIKGALREKLFKIWNGRKQIFLHEARTRRFCKFRERR